MNSLEIPDLYNFEQVCYRIRVTTDRNSEIVRIHEKKLGY